MNILEILGIVSSILVFVLSMVIMNLLKKVEVYEDDIVRKDEYISKFSEMVSKASDKLGKLDTQGAFESDDEVGYFFKYLRDLMLGISAYFDGYKK